MFTFFSVPGEKLKTDPYRLKRKFSTKVEDLDYLPLDLCHQYLRVIDLPMFNPEENGRGGGTGREG